MWLNYSATKYGPGGRPVFTAASSGPVLVRLGQGLLPVGLELAVAARMAVNASARCPCCAPRLRLCGGGRVSRMLRAGQARHGREARHGKYCSSAPAAPAGCSGVSEMRNSRS